MVTYNLFCSKDVSSYILKRRKEKFYLAIKTTRSFYNGHCLGEISREYPGMKYAYNSWLNKFNTATIVENNNCIKSAMKIFLSAAIFCVL
jgi:hypothetical protein